MLPIGNGRWLARNNTIVDIVGRIEVPTQRELAAYLVAASKSVQSLGVQGYFDSYEEEEYCRSPAAVGCYKNLEVGTELDNCLER